MANSFSMVRANLRCDPTQRSLEFSGRVLGTLQVERVIVSIEMEEIGVHVRFFGKAGTRLVKFRLGFDGRTRKFTLLNQDVRSGVFYLSQLEGADGWNRVLPTVVYASKVLDGTLGEVTWGHCYA